MSRRNVRDAPSWSSWTRYLFAKEKYLQQSERGAYELVNSGHDTSTNESTLSAEDKQSLRRVADTIPKSTFLVAVIELCERFTYYGLSGPFQNYISNSYHDPNGLPGAIGWGQSGATGLNTFFQFWCYLTPILGAVIADQYLGKYWTIFYFSIVYASGVFILFLTSLPVAIEHGFALPGLVVALIVIGLGTGGIKSNVSPLIAEQYQGDKQFVRTLSTGERVIVDPALTISRIYMMFYLCINIGALSPVATTLLEKYIGFWSAYLLSFFVFLVGFAVLVAGKRHYVMKPPAGSVIPKAFNVCWIAATHGGNLDAAKPEYLNSRGQNIARHMDWDDRFVDEVARAVVACKVFLFFPIYWAVYTQMLSNFVSQSGQMELHGIPNDIMQNLDPITIIIFIPVCDKLVYPALRRIGIQFQPITRIFWGFILGSMAMAYAALIQHRIYNAAPCFDAPSHCPVGLQSDGTYAPNSIHVGIQGPAYLFIGLSEILACITGIEYAFIKAPLSMKSFINALFLLTTAVGAGIAGLLSPFARDPYLTRMYIGLAVACFTSGVLFWVLYSPLNKLEDSMNELEHRRQGETEQLRGSDGRAHDA